jgi:hypothetical protein
MNMNKNNMGAYEDNVNQNKRSKADQVVENPDYSIASSDLTVLATILNGPMSLSSGSSSTTSVSNDVQDGKLMLQERFSKYSTTPVYSRVSAEEGLFASSVLVNVTEELTGESVVFSSKSAAKADAFGKLRPKLENFFHVSHSSSISEVNAVHELLVKVKHNGGDPTFDFYQRSQTEFVCKASVTVTKPLSAQGQPQNNIKSAEEYAALALLAQIEMDSKAPLRPPVVSGAGDVMMTMAPPSCVPATTGAAGSVPELHDDVSTLTAGVSTATWQTISTGSSSSGSNASTITVGQLKAEHERETKTLLGHAHKIKFEYKITENVALQAVKREFRATLRMIIFDIKCERAGEVTPKRKAAEASSAEELLNHIISHGEQWFPFLTWGEDILLPQSADRAPRNQLDLVLQQHFSGSQPVSYVVTNEQGGFKSVAAVSLVYCSAPVAGDLASSKAAAKESAVRLLLEACVAQQSALLHEDDLFPDELL